MNDITIGDVPALREVGDTHFPELADKYNSAVSILGEATPNVDGSYGTVAVIVTPPEWSAVVASYEKYRAQISRYLSVSRDHLDSCGETLVKMVDDVCWVDEDNKYKIENPSEGKIDYVPKPVF